MSKQPTVKERLAIVETLLNGLGKKFDNHLKHHERVIDRAILPVAVRTLAFALINALPKIIEFLVK